MKSGFQNILEVSLGHKLSSLCSFVILYFSTYVCFDLVLLYESSLNDDLECVIPIFVWVSYEVSILNLDILMEIMEKVKVGLLSMHSYEQMSGSKP